MTRWFRFYEESINDPKLLRLPDDLYRAWTILLCFASKNEGILPPADDIALSLRMKPAKVAEWITKLVRGGLIDNVEGHYEPHNWNGRQYKSDVSTERVKRFRNGKRNVSPDVSETPPEQIQTPEQIDRIGSAGASSFTEGSKALASALWKALGFERPLDVPPEYSAADWRAISWESAGWTEDLIASEVRRVGPGKPLIYYEKVFATAFAKRQAPLPIVEIQQAEKLTVKTYGTTQNQSGVVAAARRLAEQFESQSRDSIEGNSASILRLPAG